jgi:hypothetical protein
MGIPIPAVGVAPAAAIVMAAGVATTMAVTTVAADTMEEGSIRAWRTRPGTRPAFIIRSRTISESNGMGFLESFHLRSTRLFGWYKMRLQHHEAGSGR